MKMHFETTEGKSRCNRGANPYGVQMTKDISKVDCKTCKELVRCEKTGEPYHCNGREAQYGRKL